MEKIFWLVVSAVVRNQARSTEVKLRGKTIRSGRKRVALCTIKLLSTETKGWLVHLKIRRDGGPLF